MLDIIILVFVTIHIGKLAAQKGLKPGLWRLYTVLAWLGAELAGLVIGILLFGMDNIVSIILLGIGAAAGSYFAIKANLENRPDNIDHKNVNNSNSIGVSDLYPEKKN
jgi:hypothetical protein